MKILITGPALSDEGGVAAYYNVVLPHLRARFDIDYLEIGSTRGPRAWDRIGDQLRFSRALDRSRPALVHVNPSLNLKSFMRDGLFVRNAARRGVPVLVFFRGWEEPFEARVDRYLRWFFRRTYSHAARFVVLASAFQQRLRAWGVTAPIDVATTTFSTDLLAGFSLDARRAAAAASPVRVLFLARMIREKGVFETLEAIALLRARGVAVALTIAGDGPELDEVRRRARALDRDETFLQVIGDVRGDEKCALLASHNIYCCPSYTEGMPNSVLEAMAMGMAVVTCATGGLRDIFDEPEMGALVPPRNATAVADAIGRLVADRALLADIAAYNHTRATTGFAAPLVADRLAGVYGNTLQRS